MQKRKKHGFAECLNYMHMLEDGTSIHAISTKYGINKDRLHVLWDRYQSEGVQVYLRERISRQILD